MPTDIFSRAARSTLMSRIRGQNTRPEVAVRSFLHRRGLRFRLHVTALAGRPDIVLRKYHAVVLVHGCFWHQHADCPDATVPKSNRAFWRAKLSANRARDERNVKALMAAGWRVAMVWECAVRRASRHPTALARLERWIRGRQRRGEFP